jgi:hypothetical protein
MSTSDLLERWTGIAELFRDEYDDLSKRETDNPQRRSVLLYLLSVRIKLLYDAYDVPDWAREQVRPVIEGIAKELNQ